MYGFVHESCTCYRRGCEGPLADRSISWGPVTGVARAEREPGVGIVRVRIHEIPGGYALWVEFVKLVQKLSDRLLPLLEDKAWHSRFHCMMTLLGSKAAHHAHGTATNVNLNRCPHVLARKLGLQKCAITTPAALGITSVQGSHVVRVTWCLGSDRLEVLKVRNSRGLKGASNSGPFYLLHYRWRATSPPNSRSNSVDCLSTLNIA